jgi:hypothetical protein
MEYQLMAKIYRAVIQYTIYPDENGLLESDRDLYDEEELADNHRTPDELVRLVKDDLYEMITDGSMRIWDWIDVEILEAPTE